MDKSLSVIPLNPLALQERGIDFPPPANNESSFDIFTNLKPFPDGFEDYSCQRETVLLCGCGDEYCVGCGHDF